jgi:hypothetical protein
MRYTEYKVGQEVKVSIIRGNEYNAGTMYRLTVGESKSRIS